MKQVTAVEWNKQEEQCNERNKDSGMTQIRALEWNKQEK